MNIIIFEDYNIKNLYPFSINHSSFELKCGIYSNLDRIVNSFDSDNNYYLIVRDEIKKIVQEFEKRKEFVNNNLNALNNIDCFEPGGAFYAFPNVSKSGLSGQKFSNVALEQKGVALVPGTSFGDSAKDFIRISYANSMENLEKAIYRLSSI